MPYSPAGGRTFLDIRNKVALDKVAAWMADPRLHSDPGTLEDVYAAIRRTGREIGDDPLACFGHHDCPGEAPDACPPDTLRDLRERH